MIREDLSTGALETSPDQEAAGAEAALEPVTPAERYQRQGHYPGLILVEGNPALAARLERALFDDDFQVLLVSSDVTPPEVLERTIFLYQSLGQIVVYFCAVLAPGAKGRLSALAPEYFFDLSTLGLPANDAEALRMVISFVQSMRTETD